MKVRPVEFSIEVDADQAMMLKDNLENMMDSAGYDYFKRLVDSLVFEAYIKMLQTEDHGQLMYERGFIGGLEALMQNLDLEIEKMKQIVQEAKAIKDLMEGEDEEES